MGQNTMPNGELPRRRIFMMGNGKSVPPKQVAEFCNIIADGCLCGKFSYLEGMQALCVAGTIDGLARGTIDLSGDPVATVRQLIADTNNITNEPNRITDVARLFCESDEVRA